MINILTLCSLALATLHMAVAPVSAHGWVTEPPSRQARCAARQVPGCGSVQYEPQSVEGRAGSFLCNGGNRFPELNDEALWEPHFFTVPPGVNTLSFVWKIEEHARHRTLAWEYFVLTQNNAPLISFDGHNQTPEVRVEHLVPLDQFTGRQTVLARWTIGDTPNAFYSCVDLLIDPTETASAAAGPAATQLPIAIPLGLPELGFATAENSSSSANAPSVDIPLHKAFVFQGPSS